MSVCTTPVAIPAIHPSWTTALSGRGDPVVITGVPAPSAEGEKSVLPGQITGVAIPVSLEALLDTAKLAERLGPISAPGIDPKKVATVGVQVFGELNASLSDLTKLQHPEWHAASDLPMGGFAIGASTLEMWLALQGDSEAEKLFSAARLGANVVDMAASSMDTLAQVAPKLHGICLLVRTVAGFAKICVSLKEDRKP